jgi:hypothetical protein
MDAAHKYVLLRILVVKHKISVRQMCALYLVYFKLYCTEWQKLQNSGDSI